MRQISCRTDRCDNHRGKLAHRRSWWLMVMTALTLAGASHAVEPVWITTGGEECPLLRREFTLDAAPHAAIVKIVGLGHFQLFVNGRRAGDAAIHQPWSQYNKTIYYEEINITDLLREGENAVGVMLGNSFWVNPPAPQGRYHKNGPETNFGTRFLLRFELDIEMAGGEWTRVVSDEHWKTTAGPVTFSHIFGGEDYDARLCPDGWAAPGFDTDGWKAAIATAPPAARLAKQNWPPIREKQVFPAKDIVAAGTNVFHVFFSQNASAILRFTVEGRAGQSFTIQPSEYRTDEGKFMKPRWGAPVLFNYTCKGGGPETHQWLFQYQGFQAIELTGAVPASQPNPDGLPVLQKLEMVHVHTDLPEAGTFRTARPVYNGTHELIDWAIRSNMTYVLTDCPHREKLGWLECAYLLAPTFCYRYDCREWFAKITRDIREAQEPSGRILTVAPSYPETRFPDAFHWTVEWGAAGAILPWHHYVWYGDPQILRDNFDCMRRFVDFVASASTDSIAPAGLGDWYDYGHGKPPGPSRFTPTDLTATAVQVMCIDAVIRAAEVLDRPEAVARYRALREATAAAFLKRFYHPETKTFTNTGSCQCAHTIALTAGLAPEADRQAVLDAVVADLAKRDWQQTPGDVGHVFFIRALAEGGRSDVLHRVYSREGKGSYGGILAKGLTAMPETWDAMNDGYQSHNHCMLGHVIEWFYGYVGGIRQQPGGIGWKRILIAPEPGPLAQADVTFASPAGRITSRWRVADGTFQLEVDVPEGVVAELVLPDGSRKNVGAGHHAAACPYVPERE
ncbi:MAG: family 78 glycoside hydrolase catalytic domain [Phycisphaerae bacterium]|nr:family 78 glycoside hydrolase catalytic domain [Phycisphaerae bacterium]